MNRELKQIKLQIKVQRWPLPVRPAQTVGTESSPLSLSMNDSENPALAVAVSYLYLAACHLADKIKIDLNSVFGRYREECEREGGWISVTRGWDVVTSTDVT